MYIVYVHVYATSFYYGRIQWCMHVHMYMYVYAYITDTLYVYINT